MLRLKKKKETHITENEIAYITIINKETWLLLFLKLRKIILQFWGAFFDKYLLQQKESNEYNNFFIKKNWMMQIKDHLYYIIKAMLWWCEIFLLSH